MSFDSIISCSEKDGMKVYTKNMNWSDLGFNFEGKTQALIFDAPISVERNKFMFEQYKKGYVRNHSVGMNYTKILFCVGNKEWATAEEYEAWEKQSRKSLTWHIRQLFFSFKCRKAKGTMDFLTFHCWRVATIWRDNWKNYTHYERT